MAKRTYGRAVATTLLAVVASACADDGVTPPSDGPEPPSGAGPARLGLVEVTISGIGTETPSATAISAPSVAELKRLRSERGAPAGIIALQSLEPPANGNGGGNGTIRLEPVSSGSFTEGVRGDDGVRYLQATFRVRNAQSDGTRYTTPRQNLTFLSVDTDDTYGETTISQLRLFDGTLLPDATGTPIAEGMLPTGQVNRNGALQIVSSTPDVLQVFEESEVDPGVIDAPAGVETIFPYGFMVRHATSTSTRTLPASPAPGEFTGVVTFAFTVPLQPTSADDPFEISAVFLALDDSDTRVTQSFEEQTVAGQAAFEARAASLVANEVTLLPGGSSTGGIAARLVCRVRTAGTATSPSAFLVNPPGLASLSPDPYATDGSGSHITLPTFIEASFSGAVDDADANTFAVHGAQTGRHFLGEAYSSNGTATVSSPQASANAFFPGEAIEVSLTRGLGACPPHVARLWVAVNNGNGTFGSAVNYSVGDFTRKPSSIATGDLDGDGDLDIATAVVEDVLVLRNNGNGTFASPVNYSTEALPIDIAFGDLDGDGDLDIVTANGGSGDVSVLLNNGNGAFAAAVKYNAGHNPLLIAVGDLDGDGDLDIATANLNSDGVSVLLNHGNGTFATAVNYSIEDALTGIAVGDLDGDGDLDIATSTVSFDDVDDVSVLLNNGTGTFAAAVNYNAGDNLQGIAVGDLDGDGDLDIAAPHQTRVPPNQISNYVSVLLNNGNATFGTAVNYNLNLTAVSVSPSDIAVGDLDGDGDLDLATANVNSNDNSDAVSVLLNNGNGTFASAVNYNAGEFSNDVALGDLDGDGDLDITTANSNTEDVSVLLNNN